MLIQRLLIKILQLNNTMNFPKVGVATILTFNNKVLLGLRVSEHGEGTWGFPGGHLEEGETWEECSKRELTEETNLEIEKHIFTAVTNDIFDDKHYVTIFMRCEYEGGDIIVKEPNKMIDWKWFEWDSLPENLFYPINNLIKQGYSPFNGN